MPGSFPEQMHGARHVQNPAIEILDPGFLKNQKAKHKSGHRSSSDSSSESESAWEDDPENSSLVNIEHGDYNNAGRRGRGRKQHSGRSKKSHKHRSHSKGKLYSRSRSRGDPREIIVDPYIEKSSRRRRGSDLMDERHSGRYSPTSSAATSNFEDSVPRRRFGMAMRAKTAKSKERRQTQSEAVKRTRGDNDTVVDDLLAKWTW
jgi:hypothetical protein